MQILIAHDAAVSARTGALVVPVFSDGELSGAAQAIDTALDGAITDVLSSEEIKGKIAECALLHAGESTFSPRPHRRIRRKRRNSKHPMLARYAGAAVRYLGRRNVE